MQMNLLIPLIDERMGSNFRQTIRVFHNKALNNVFIYHPQPPSSLFVDSLSTVWSNYKPAGSGLYMVCGHNS